MGKQTAVKNRLRALLAQQSEEIRSEVERVENLFTDKGMKILMGLALPEREAKLVGALLRTYDHLEERINETNALVKELYAKMPSAQLIQSVPGFGTFLAALVAVEIEDIGRFEDVGKFHAYAGVIPRLTAKGRGAGTAKSSRKGIGGCAGQRWKRSGRLCGLILISAAFMIG